jgi:hypothetical protein
MDPLVTQKIETKQSNQENKENICFLSMVANFVVG